MSSIKKKHIAQNQEQYLKAANEGVSPDRVYAAMIGKRILCTIAVVLIVMVVIGLFLAE